MHNLHGGNGKRKSTSWGDASYHEDFILATILTFIIAFALLGGAFLPPAGLVMLIFFATLGLLGCRPRVVVLIRL